MQGKRGGLKQSAQGPHTCRGFMPCSCITSCLPACLPGFTLCCPLPLLSHRLFIERGGIELLLKMHTLPKVPATFGFSPPSHALLSIFRGLTASHAQVGVGDESAQVGFVM